MANKLFTELAYNPATIAADGTTTGNVIDMEGFQSLTLSLFSGAITDGTFTPLVEQADNASMTGATEVTDFYLIGTEADSALTAADDNAAKKLGVLNKERYVRLSIVASGVTTGGLLGAMAIKSHANFIPTDAQ